MDQTKSSVLTDRLSHGISSSETQVSIHYLIDAIKINKNFSKLIIYSLNTLKSYLVNEKTGTEGVENSISIIKNDFLKVTRKILEVQINNEEVLIKIGEIIYYIASNLINKPKEFEIFVSSQGIIFVKELLESIPIKHVEAYKIYIKIFQIIIEAHQKDANFNIEGSFATLITLINKFNDNTDLLEYLLETLKKISQMKKFKEYFSNDILDCIFSILSSTSSNKIANLGLQILDIVVKTIDNRDIIRSNKPIALVVKLLKKFKKDNLVSFHACGFLSKVLEREDVLVFLEILKIKNLKNIIIESEPQNIEGGLSEINEMLINQDDDSFNSLKKNITRVLILMSKDKNFLDLLNEINSLDIFVSLLKSDLEIYSQNLHIKNEEELFLIENILPDLLRLILSLLNHCENNYDFEEIDYKQKMRNTVISRKSHRPSVVSATNSNTHSPFLTKKAEGESVTSLTNPQTTYNDIYFCLFKSLNLFTKDKSIVYDILNYISGYGKKLVEEMFLEFEMKDVLSTLTNLLKFYHNTTWIYSFFYKILPIYSKTLKISEEDVILCKTRDAKKTLESLKLVYDESKKDQILNFLFETSLFLILSNTNINVFAFNESTFNELKDFLLSEYLYKENNVCVSSVITLIFSICENKHITLMEDKCNLISNLIKNCIEIENKERDLIIKYILLRLNRLVDLKVDTMNKFLFNQEYNCDFIVYILNLIKSQEKIDEQMTKDTLLNIQFMLNNSDQKIITKFLQDNGLITLMSLNGIYDFEINKLIIGIIHALSVKYFKEASLVFKNFLSFRDLINSLKSIKFSKGINEKIYWEILNFSKSIIKSCEYYEAIEESNLVEHIANEYTEIYGFYLDSKNRILEIISEILAMFSKENSLLKCLLNSQFPTTMESIITHLAEKINEEIPNEIDLVVEHLLDILISFFKSKEYSKLIYTNYRPSLETIKNILFNSKISENSLNKFLILCQLIIEYENFELPIEKIITTSFLRELSLKIPAGLKTQKDVTDKCIMLIENPYQDRIRKTIHESNSKLIKELSELAKSDRKKAVRKRDGSISGRSSNIYQDENPFEPINANLRKRKSLINIFDNPKLKAHFETISNSISAIVEIITNTERIFNKEIESEQLSDLLRMLCIFAKNEDNIKMIYDRGIFDKLIIILEDENILSFAKDQGFNLIEKLIDDDIFILNILDNSKANEFFFKEFSKIGNIYLPETSEYNRHKVLIISKVLSRLSAEKSFISKNSQNLHLNEMFNIISTIECDKTIILNLLSIFCNVITQNKECVSNLKIATAIQKIWKQFNDIRVSEKIMKIIELLYLEETLIREMIDTGLIDNLNSSLKANADSEGIFNIVSLMDTLMFHRYFASKIIEQKTLLNLNESITNNMFNTKIIEKAISILLKSSKLDKSFITILGIYKIKELCLNILLKYMTTCHVNIIKTVQELILMLVTEENNLNFFSKTDSMDIILKAFKLNLKNKDLVLNSLKLMNIITMRDADIKIEKSREKKNTITKPEGNTVKSTIIQIVVTSNETEKSSIVYDFAVIIEIINEILSNYHDNLELIIQLCSLINNIFKISNEVWLKKFMIDVIVNNADKYINKEEYVQLFLTTMHNMIKADKGILDVDCNTVLFFINKILNGTITYFIVLRVLKILKNVCRSKIINMNCNFNEIIKILRFVIESNKSFHVDDLILTFSKIIELLFINTSFYKENTSDFLIFLLNYINSKGVQSEIHRRLLEEIKNVSLYYHIREEDKALKSAKLIKKIFEENLGQKNNKNLINIFQIISALAIQSDCIKSAMSEIKFNEKIKLLLIKDSFEDMLIEYQAKGCLLNLKIKKPNLHGKLTHASTLRSMSIMTSHIEIKEEIKDFLRLERIVRVFTDKGENKEKTLSMDESLNKIMAYTKKKNALEIFDEMDIKEMDSCVRSCGTAAFSKSKGLFSKKPKPARCFSILGFKSLQGQKTFNIECEKEEDCIKFVDYISILIQNYKSSKEEVVYLNTDTLSNVSSLNRTFEKFK